MLKLIPDLTFPLTASSIDPLFSNLVQLNGLDAGIHEPVQRSVSLYLHIYDIFVKSKGKYDYRSHAGRAQIKQDAFRFCPSQVVTRFGDLNALHLALDWHDTVRRCQQFGIAEPSANVNELLNASKDLVGMPPEDYKRIGALLDMLSKKSIS